MVAVWACFAVSADGKISPQGSRERYVRLGSDEDIRRLKALRDTADAVLMGGATFRAWPREHTGLAPKDEDTLGHKPLLHGLITRGRALHRDLPPESPLFGESHAPVTVFTARMPRPEEQAAYPERVRWVSIPTVPPVSAQMLVSAVLAEMAASGVRTLLLEGGGEVFSLFLAARAVQRLYLTYCPLLLGGQDAPGLLGEGFAVQDVATAPRLGLEAAEPVGDELFCRYGITYG